MDAILALKVNDLDNVATLFSSQAKAGITVEVKDKKGRIQQVQIHADIPYGHKIAVSAISKGSPILKYGEEIGVATSDIAPGDYVHVHNLDSQRGRGDLQQS